MLTEKAGKLPLTEELRVLWIPDEDVWRRRLLASRKGPDPDQADDCNAEQGKPRPKIDCDED